MKKLFGGDIDSRIHRHQERRKVYFGGGVNASSYEKSYRRHNARSKALQKKKSWAETHGQKEGHQLKGTITGRKFGPKSY